MIQGARRINLSSGDLNFSAYEMGDGPLVLCLHGFPDTPFTWRHLLPQLAEAGYRAVAPNLRGYEPQSQPEERPVESGYRVAELAQDVEAWIHAGLLEKN